ncbi:lanthionine synthetase LanC family protein [Deinococcus sp. QL22]|uniref:lanthionine synthetase LanC family protein n=1 Tax=Deinococcus sp. QL22 TaxID=2939437 RepID=UPI0020173D77|nr:lanthionine synthetase LanC family protein [Deinococcus sp. QL22]UQN08022.1 T3SS effector HopA1 family protein [Deinococcus sp. QL22]
MSGYLGQVQAVVNAIVIDSPTTFSWYGQRSSQLPLRIRRSITPEVARAHLLATLQNQLYGNFYQIGFVAPTVSDGAGRDTDHLVPLTEALSKANTGQGCWEPGWEVTGLEPGWVMVQRRGLTLHVSEGQYCVLDGRPAEIGGSVSVRLPHESFEVSPGFYMALSDQPLIWDGDETLIRVYWNLRPEAAALLVSSVTTRLNAESIGFRLKVLTAPTQYLRCDAGVLYFLKKDYARAASLLPNICQELGEGLKKETPSFTKVLASGVGLAEDPGQGESFGQHRCQLLAEGLIRAHERNQQTVPTRLETVVECFAESGIDLQLPYLSGKSHDLYEPWFVPPAVPTVRIPLPASTSVATSAAFLDTADQLAQRIVHEAVWHRDHCNWLGLVPRSDGKGHLGLTYGAMGSNLYDGTAGIALFLAELALRTGDLATRRTALGAIRQALHAAETLPPDNVLGLYTGWTGIALTATRLATLLGEEDLRERAHAVWRRALQVPRKVGTFDLLSGRAGAIIALIALHALLDDPPALEAAILLGDELLVCAQKSKLGLSWQSDTAFVHPNLTGLSHGTAGASLALLELFQATGNLAYRQAAAGAFDYERAWFSPEEGNWPHLQEEPVRGTRPGTRLPFRVQWCHGAPGIALSRLRAYELLGSAVCREEALIALDTTWRGTVEARRSGSLSFCLCHGLSGNAEVLTAGAQAIGWRPGEAMQLAWDIAQEGMEAYSSPGRLWPCGIPIPAAETLGLFLGLAGIGHFYLRMHDSTVPSILLLRREEYVSRLDDRVPSRNFHPPQVDANLTVQQR